MDGLDKPLKSTTSVVSSVRCRHPERSEGSRPKDLLNQTRSFTSFRMTYDIAQLT